MEKVTIHTARHYYQSPQLATTVRGVHGYQASCACGWRGPVRYTYGVAGYDAAEHNQTPHTAPGFVVTDTPPTGATDSSDSSANFTDPARPRTRWVPGPPVGRLGACGRN